MNLKYYLRGLGIGIIMTSLIMGIAARDGKETLTNEEIKERARALGMTEEGTVLADLAKEEEFSSPSPADLKEAPQPSGEASPTPEALPQRTGAPKESDEPSPAAARGESEEVVGEGAPSASKDSAPSPSDSRTPSASPVSATATPGHSGTPSPTPGKSPVPSKEPEASPGKNEGQEAVPTASPKQENADNGITIQVVSGDTSYSVCQKLEAAGLISSASEYDAYLCENGYDKRINVGDFLIPRGAGEEQIARIIARLQ